MSIRTFTVGMAALLLAVPAAAQSRGTMEFGGFGSAATFDNALSLKTGYGGGGRIGMYLDPRWAIEFEDAEMRATRPNGLRDVNVGILSGRLVLTPFTAGRLAMLVGAGAGVSTETNFLHSYGVDALVGARVGLTPNVALRVDGVWDWLANEDWKSYKSVRVGFSVFRHPRREVRTVTVVQPAPALTVVHQDSVSAAETRRLRQQEAALLALQDSLRRVPQPLSCTDALETRVHFITGETMLTDAARATLAGRMQVFGDNMRVPILIVRRPPVADEAGKNVVQAVSVREYLVGRGIAPGRITVLRHDERAPLSIAIGKDGAAATPCGAFRIAIAPDAAR